MTRPKSAQPERGTTLGVGLWDWPPWVAMSLQARNLWLALYTSGPAKRLPPGLWHGGLAVMAEESKADVGVTQLALQELLDGGLIEFDAATRVARLTELPDRGERPHNGDVIRAWWTRWRTVPACAVRDRHVDLLRWLAGPQLGHDRSSAAWAATFGTVGQDGHRAGHGVGHGVPHRGGHPRGEGSGSGSVGEEDPALVAPTSRDPADGVDAPGLAPVVRLAHAALERTLAARHGGAR